MSARNPFAKFSLKPSTLSQHTVNFNKILEEVPAPKIESIILEKPKLAGVALAAKPEAAKPIEQQEPTEKKEENVEASSTFLFGESLTDRVINASETQALQPATEKTNGQFTNGTAGAADSNVTSDGKNKAAQMFNKQDSTAASDALLLESKHVHDSLENDANTLIRMNCKLFVLDKDSKDQANWAERGYGILKMIECDEGDNCKIMMWTDKCFRLVLNTKMFESMTMEKVNRKSIRLNAQDDGTIKMFLIKCGHPNECEELSHKMIYRLKIYKEKLAKGAISKPNVPRTVPAVVETKTEALLKSIVYECDCETKSLKDADSEVTKAKMTIYRSKSSGDNSNKQPLFLDINSNVDDANKQILSNRYLKSVKLNVTDKPTGDYLDFEVAQSFHISYKVTIKTEATVKEFFDLYDQEQKVIDETSSNNSLDNSETSSDDEDEESDSTSTKNEKNSDTNNSASLENSVSETNKSTLALENVESNQDEEQVISVSKKRRCEDDEVDIVQNENVKKMTLADTSEGAKVEQEETSTSLKRHASDSQPDSSQETQFVKKSKSGEDN